MKQWHRGIDPEFGRDLGDFYEGCLRSQPHDLNLTDTDLERERLELA